MEPVSGPRRQSFPNATSIKLTNVSGYRHEDERVSQPRLVLPAAYFSFPALLHKIHPVVLNATFQHIVEKVWGGAYPSHVAENVSLQRVGPSVTNV
jgi:hypothetical protein